MHELLEGPGDSPAHSLALARPPVPPSDVSSLPLGTVPGTEVSQPKGLQEPFGPVAVTPEPNGPPVEAAECTPGVADVDSEKVAFFPGPVHLEPQNVAKQA